jgi:PEP-CTERM motif
MGGVFLKKAALFLLVPALFFALASSAFADTLDFTVTSSVTDLTNLDTMVTQTINQPFTITFSLPSVLASLATPTAATVTAGAISFTDPGALVEFFPSSLGGLFNLGVTFQGNPYTASFFGPQSYSGNGPFTLLTGTFALTDEGSGLGSFAGQHWFGDFGPGKVVVTGGSTAAPEPGTFALLTAGLAGLAAFRRKLRAA